MQRARGQYRIRWFRFLMLAIVGCAMYQFISHQAQLSTIRQETEICREQLNQQSQLNTELLQQRNLLNSREYVEKLAREELGLVKPGETPYITAEKN